MFSDTLAPIIKIASPKCAKYIPARFLIFTLLSEVLYKSVNIFPSIHTEENIPIKKSILFTEKINERRILKINIITN